MYLQKLEPIVLKRVDPYLQNKSIEQKLALRTKQKSAGTCCNNPNFLS